MRTLPRRAVRALSLAVIALALGALPVAAGAPQPGQPLDPPPPDIYTCVANGAGTTCHAHTENAYGPVATGIWCEGAGDPFEIWDQATHLVDFTRTYDRDGKLLTRQGVHTFPGARLSNPANGLEVPYRQRDHDVERLAIPGDFDSATLVSVGSMVAVLPGAGAVLVERGRYVATGDEVLQATGRRDLSDFFSGDADALDRLCEALAG